MKLYAATLLLALSCLSYSQVGIKTETPQSQLDVNGSVTFRGKVYTEGDDATVGNPGVKGQVLVSSGPGAPPKWLTLNIPDDQGKYYLIYNDTFDDRTGVSFSSTEITGLNAYAKGTLLTSLTGWKKIPGMSKQFEVFSVNNKTYFTFETVAQIATVDGGNYLDAVEFACGIFVDGKLEGVRINTVEQAGEAYAPFRTLTMLHVSENVSKGTHTLDVACTRRANYSTSVALGVGRGMNATNLNNFMAQSSMKIEVFEIPDEYVDIED